MRASGVPSFIVEHINIPLARSLSLFSSVQSLSLLTFFDGGGRMDAAAAPSSS